MGTCTNDSGTEFECILDCTDTKGEAYGCADACRDDQGNYICNPVCYDEYGVEIFCGDPCYDESGVYTCGSQTNETEVEIEKCVDVNGVEYDCTEDADCNNNDGVVYKCNDPCYDTEGNYVCGTDDLLALCTDVLGESITCPELLEICLEDPTSDACLSTAALEIETEDLDLDGLTSDTDLLAIVEGNGGSFEGLGEALVTNLKIGGTKKLDKTLGKLLNV